MRVYAVFKKKSGLKLEIFPSKKSFESQYSWLDENIVRTATKDELIEVYNHPHEPPHPDSKWHLVLTPEEIKAHDMLHAEYLKLKTK